MDYKRIPVSIACLLVFSLSSLACPGGSNEKYCPGLDGCVAVSQNCSHGEILSCVNETAVCSQNATRYCVDVHNYTCGNFSCDNETVYCAGNESCIKPNQTCVEKESCDLADNELCEALHHSNDTMEYAKELGNSSVANITVWLKDCHFTIDAATLKMCNISKHRKNRSCEIHELCHELREEMKDHWMPNGTISVEGCNITMNATVMEVCNISCEIHKLCHKLREEMKDHWMTNGTISLGHCNVTLNATVLGMCNITMKNHSCEIHELCHELREEMKDHWMPNGTISVEGCNITMNATVMEVCNISCEIHKLCHKLREEMKDHWMTNETISLGHCNVTLNATVLGMCNITMKNHSCEIHELCHELREEMKDHWMPNGTISVEGCNITMNATVMEVCNISCEIHKLCHKLREEMKDHWMTNETISLGHCNVTLNATVLGMCNITMKNHSCEIHELCHELREEMKDHWMPNGTISVEGCNITMNATVMEVCNISCEIHKLCHKLREEMKDHWMTNWTISLGHCNVTLNATVLAMCNITMKNHSCEIHKLCHELREEMKDNWMPNGTIYVEGCNITMNSTVMEVCNISMHENKNRSCEIHKLCHELREEMKDNWMPNGTIYVEGCNITMNATVMEVCNISMHGKKNRSCEIHELCHELREEMKDNWMPNGTIYVEGCNITMNATVMEVCNISMHGKKNRSCEIHKLCHELREEMKDNWMPNGTIYVEGCNITMNATVMEVCNISMHENKNRSCEIHKLCHELREEMKDNWMPNGTIYVEGCNITMNATVMEVCNISMHGKKNRSCEIHELCHELREEMKDNWMPNGTIYVEGCNITMNATVMEVCNISIHGKKNRSCEIHKLCHELREEMKDNWMPNGTIYVEGCNITMNATVMEVCNISMHGKKNRSCEIHKLCHELREEMKDHWMPNGTIYVEGCNITMNATVMEVCNISMHGKKNRSCEIHKLCHELREEMKDHWMPNGTIYVEGCNITMNATVMEVCNISMHGKKNRSCEIHKLCHELREEMKDNWMPNGTIYVEGCNITMNATVMEVCNISCEIHKLCHKLREEMKDHWMTNGTISLGHCNVTLNAAVLGMCNITMKNHSCEIHELCPHLRNMFKNDKDDRDEDDYMNRTISVKGCNITLNATIVHMCNISDESCKIDKLCDELRNLTANHTKYSLPRGPMRVGICNITLNTTALEKECNISLGDLSVFKYKMFFNGFKIADSVGPGVGRIAVRKLGVSQDDGVWNYKNGAGSWTPIGAVSSSRALVLEAGVQLMFVTNDMFWHGLATLKYSPVKSGATGSYADVSSILEDPRNTLALVQVPPSPVANVSKFIGPAYTVPEDEKTAGFKIDDKILLRLSYNVSDNMPENETEYLNDKVEEDYEKQVMFAKSCVPAIAIISTGPVQEGKWQIKERSLPSVKIDKPEVVTPRDTLRFVSARNKHGNWSMKFVPIVYCNGSIEISRDYFGVPDFIAHAFRGVMTIEKTPKENKYFVKSVLKEMTSGGVSFSLSNFNGTVDKMGGSKQNKTAAKDIAAKVFERVTVPSVSPIHHLAGLPPVLYPKRNIAILNNPTAFTFGVHVTRANDQPVVTAARIFLPAIAYNLTTNPNVGFLVKDLTTKPSEGEVSPLVTDIDGDISGFAVVQARNSSVGLWQYQAPSSSTWLELIINNEEYSEAADEGLLEVFLLTPAHKLRFKMHGDDIMWSNLEALDSAKIVFLAWDLSDGYAAGLHNVTRPSNETSAYSARSVAAVERRIGCDGRTGSEGRTDRCGVCGGDGDSCLGCDQVLNSGAVVDDCGNCTGGINGSKFNFRKDCARECDLSFNDSCGVCQRKNNIRNFTDCTGTCFGGAIINTCRFCVGGSSGKPGNYGEDACGVCNGDNSTCLDCNSVPNGGKEVDFCGSCRLPSDPLYNNECVKLKLNVPESGPMTGNVVVEVTGAGLNTYSTVRCMLTNWKTNATTPASSSSFQTSKGSRVISLTTPSLSPGSYKIKCKFNAESVYHFVEDTGFLVYNKSSISFASVSPDEVFVDTAVVAHVIGAGFVNTTDLACVTRDGKEFRAAFNDDTNVSCWIPDTKKSAPLQLALSFSRVDRAVAAGKHVNFTIFAQAPRPTRARFLDNLQGILVYFDLPSESKAESEDCASFFKPENVSTFGSKARCKFRTSKTMIIQLRGRPTILPGDEIGFKMASIKQRFQGVTKEPALPVEWTTLLSPPNPVVPKAVLSGQSLLGLCASLKLNGGQSYGGGGRRLKYTWFVEWVDPNNAKIDSNATADLENITKYFEAINGGHEQRHRLRLPFIVVGQQYKFLLSVTNFLLQTSENASMIVQRDIKQLPGLNVGAKEKSIKAALGTTLQGRVKLSSCLPRGFKPKVLFLWEIRAVGINLGVVDQPRLNIAPRLLAGEKSYTFTFTATMASDLTLSTTVEINVEVQSSPLKATIKGGDVIIVGENDNFDLDASPSSDPDGTSEDASYEWLCFDSNGDLCFETDPTNPSKQRRMVLPARAKTTIDVSRQLKTKSTYTFKMIFRKGSRKHETKVEVEVKSGAPPRVIIRPLTSLKVNPNEKLTLKTLLISKQSVTTKWTCVEEEGFGFINLDAARVLLAPRTKTFVKGAGKSQLFGSPALVIDKDKLESGVQYKFRLTAVHVHANSSSYADMTILTNAPPSQGTLDVDPASGFFGNTTYTFSALEGWSDTDLPLSYQFGYYAKDERTGKKREVLLGFLAKDSVLELDILPQGEEANNYTLSIFVDVFDIYKAKSRQTAEVVVRPRQLDAAAIGELAGDVDSDFDSGDLGKATAKAIAVVAALSGGGSADANSTRALKDFKKGVVDKVLFALEKGGVQDRSGIDVVIGSLFQMTRDCKPDCDTSRVASNLAKLEGSGQSSGSGRIRRAVQDEADVQVKTGDQVETVLQIFENIIDASDYTNSSIEAKTSLLNTIEAQEKSLCKGLALGEPAVVAKSNITVVRAVQNSFTDVESAFLEVSTSDAPEFIEATVTFRLGQTLKSAYETWACASDDTCTGTCIASAQFKHDLLISHDPSELNLTRLSDVVSVHLFNPQTQAVLTVSGLATPVALRFPIENAESLENYTKECRVWDDGAKEWQVSGCSGYKTINTSIIECYCTKLGFITVFKGEEIVPTTSPDTPKPTQAPSKPEQSVKVQFAFAANYTTTISGNMTKTLFIARLKPFLSSLLNISEQRISNLDIRKGSIIVSFEILPSNNSADAPVNSSVALLQRLVSGNNVNFTLGSGPVLRVDPSSFLIVLPPSSTTEAPKTPTDDDDDDDDDGLSTSIIIIIAVVCSLAFLAILVGILYYIFKVRPANQGKVSPKNSELQLQEHHNNDVPTVEVGANNNAVDVDEKAV